MSDGVWICRVGMVTAVGGGTDQTAASVRTGISRYAESSVMNKRFQPMTLALAPDDALPRLVEGLEGKGLTSRQRRMLRLATPALSEAMDGLPAGKELPFLVAGPEALPDPERAAPMAGAFLEWLKTQADAPVDLKTSRVFPRGRAGGLQALDAALDLLAGGEHERVVVGGVDSHLDLYLLAQLDQADRVLADGVMNGFAPGEGAGFLVLCSDEARKKAHPDVKTRVLRPGLADEPGHRYSEEPYKGEGLAEAVAAALKQADGVTIGTALVSINGENFGAKEWGVVSIRNSAALGESRFEHPADCFGDLGAAVAPVLIGLARKGMAGGYLPGPCLVSCSSEGAPRAAVVVTEQTG